MRHDQDRDRYGKFDTVDSPHKFGEEERLENVVSTKVASRELRQFSILYDQHRKMFGWQTMSDMYRDFLRDGFAASYKRIANPDKELKQIYLETQQMELASKAARKHLSHHRAVEFTAEQVDILKRENDFGELRKVLADFVQKTRETADPVIKNKRQEEFERRGWDKMLKDLGTGNMSVTKFDHAVDVDED